MGAALGKEQGRGSLRSGGRGQAWWAAVLTIVLLSFALRAYRIDGQSLWYDEGVSVALAPRSLETIARCAAADIHPPLYYYLLHFWMGPVGSSELAVRWLSLLMGVLLIPLLYQLGRRLFSAEVGTVAAFLAALSPLLVYYSQETRMYMQVAFLAVLSMYLFIRLWEERPAPWWMWLAYGAATLGALYSHYFAVSLLVIQNLGVWLNRPRRRHLSWLASQGAVILAFLPWLAYAYRPLVSWPATSEPFPLTDLIGQVFAAFSYGYSSGPGLAGDAALVFLLVVGLLWPLTERQKAQASRGLAWALLYCGVPILLLFLLSLRRPFYHPKFLLLAVPGYALWLALGLSSLRRLGEGLLARWQRAALAWRWVVPLLGVGAIGFLSAHSVWAYYTDPKLARDDYRRLVGDIRYAWREGDGIVLNAPGQIEIFSYYYRNNGPVYPLPKQRPINEEQTEEELRALVASHQRLWVVLWATAESDPHNFMENWLDRHAFKSINRWYGTIRLALYTIPGKATGEKQAVKANFGDLIELTGYRLEPSKAQPGQILPLTLYWRALRPIDQRYTVFAHLLGPGDYLWGQRDSQPAGGARPTPSWLVGEIVEDRLGIPVLLGTPPGPYFIEVGLYQPESGQRLPVLSPYGKPVENRVILTSVLVLRPSTPPPTEALAFQHPLAVGWHDGLKLLGFSLHRYASDSVELRAGDTGHLTLFWQASKKPAGRYLVILTLRDRAGRNVSQWQGHLVEGNHSTDRWEEGEVVRGQYRLALPARGEYNLILSLVDEATGQAQADGKGRQEVVLGKVSVR